MSTSNELLKADFQSTLTDAENFDIHIGHARANMLRKALGQAEVVYPEFYQALLEQSKRGPLLS